MFHFFVSAHSNCLKWWRSHAQLLAPVLGIYGAIFVFMVALGGWLAVDLLRGRDQILAYRSHMAVQKSNMVSTLLNHTFLVTGYVLNDVVDRVTPKDLVYPDPDTAHAQKLQELLNKKAGTVRGIFGIVLYNKTCTLITRANGQGLGHRSDEALCLERKASQGAAPDIEYLPAEKSNSQRPIISISRNLPSPQGHFLGGAVAAIDLNEAQRWLSTFSVGYGDVMAITDRQGVLLARNPAMPEIMGRTAQDAVFSPIFASIASTATIIARSPNDHRERIYGMSKIEGVPLLVIVGFDRAAALQDWHHRGWQLMGGFVALLVLTLLVARAQITALYQREMMRKLATTDALTGIANRRHLLGISTIEMAQAQRHRTSLSFLMIDIDHFKRVNDTWGHPAGDRVLQHLAATMAQTLRPRDSVGRLGGEEFAMLLPETDIFGAQALAESLRVAIEREQMPMGDEGRPVAFTVSIGVATMAAEVETLEALLARADKALYQAKKAGRNQVVLGC